jgi:hypothetical protein
MFTADKIFTGRFTPQRKRSLYNKALPEFGVRSFSFGDATRTEFLLRRRYGNGVMIFSTRSSGLETHIWGSFPKIIVMSNSGQVQLIIFGDYIIPSFLLPLACPLFFVIN